MFSYLLLTFNLELQLLSLSPHMNYFIFIFILFYFIFFVFQVMFYSLAVLTFGTAVPAGQFVPGIMIGSTYGRLVGMFVVNFYKKLNIEEGT